YTYSPLGQLKSATAAGVTWNYAYDTTGERLSKSVNNEWSYSFRGAGGETLSEYLNSCGTLVWTRDLIYAGGQLIGAAKATMTQPTFSLATATASVNEGAGSVPVSVTLTTPNGSPLGCPASVVVSIPSGGANYAAFSQTVTFASGSANGATQSVSIPIADD